MVIAIISMLSSVILASLNSVRAKANDAERLAEAGSVRSALELYYHDNNAYPSTGGSWWGNCSSFGSRPVTGATAYVPNVAPKYITVLPLDPRPIGTSGCYLYNSNGTDYMFLVYQTVQSYTVTTNKWKRPQYPNESNFSFYSPGAQYW